MSNPSNEPTVETRLVYQGKILNLRVDTVQMPRGRTATREIVEHNECVCVVPLDQDRNVVLVRQYRKCAEEELLEVPAGGMESGEAAAAAALRELQEETGSGADQLEHLATFWTTPGFCTELMHAYLATGLRPGDPDLVPDDDEVVHAVRVPLDRIPDMIRSGEIKDAKSIATLLMVLNLTPAH